MKDLTWFSKKLKDLVNGELTKNPDSVIEFYTELDKANLRWTVESGEVVIVPKQTLRS